MNTQKYRERLLELEKSLASKTERSVAAGRAEFIDSAHDTGDASVADEVASEQFSEAGQGAGALQEDPRRVASPRRRVGRQVHRRRQADRGEAPRRSAVGVALPQACGEELEKESGKKTPTL